MDLLQQLQRLQMDRLDLDEMIALSVLASGMIAQYKMLGMEAPEWLNEAGTTLEKELKARRRENLERALKLAKQKRASLSTAEEKRAAADTDIQRLEQALAQQP